VKLCAGHPFLLNVCRELALNDTTAFSDLLNQLSSDMKHNELLEKILSAGFERLSDTQQKILLSVLIFKTGTTIGELYPVS
jgi:hypothetical protein